MKRLLLACAATVLVVPAASATTGSCVDVADAAYDALRAYSAPAVYVPFEETDLVNVRTEATTGAVTAVFTVLAEPDPAPGANYELVLKFRDADHEYMFQAEVNGGGLRAPVGDTYEFSVKTTEVGAGGSGASSWEHRPATGSVDVAARTVTFTAPASSFDSLATGHTFDLVEASSHVGVGGTQLQATDFLTMTGTTVVVGAGCS